MSGNLSWYIVYMVMVVACGCLGNGRHEQWYCSTQPNCIQLRVKTQGPKGCLYRIKASVVLELNIYIGLLYASWHNVGIISFQHSGSRYNLCYCMIFVVCDIMTYYVWHIMYGSSGTELTLTCLKRKWRRALSHVSKRHWTLTPQIHME